MHSYDRGAHPDDDALTAFVEGCAGQVEEQVLRAHLFGCDGCRDLVGVIASTGAPRQLTPALLHRGAQVGRYRIEALLGAGAFGVVYRAHDPSLDRHVALKLVRGDLSDRAAMGREALLGQARRMAQVTHAHLVAVHDLGDSTFGPFVTLQLVEGVTAATWASARPWQEIVGLLLPIAGALAAIHDAGLAHADVKADNILVAAGGHGYLTDFGAAVAPGSLLMGADGHVAPELLRGGAPDARSDQYAYCSALRQLLAGCERGFAACPGELRSVVLRGIRPGPAERHPSMEALAAELAATLQPRLVQPRRAPRLDPAWRQLEAMVRAGSYVAGRATADAVWASAKASADGWSAARTQLLRAELCAGAADFLFAEECYHAALVSAERAGADQLRLAALQGLTQVVGHQLRRTSEGLRFSDQALPLLERLDAGGATHARWCSLRGGLLGLRGKADDARRYHDEALARVAASDAAPLEQAHALIYQGEAYLADPDRLLEAITALERATAIRAHALGSAHPLVGIAQTPLAFAQLIAGRPRDALQSAQRAVSGLQARLGADAPRLAVPLQALAQARLALGERTHAVPLFERALGLLRKGSGASTPRLATLLYGLAACSPDQARAERLRCQAQRIVRTPFEQGMLGAAWLTGPTGPDRPQK